jgi:hypothetical protein
MRMMGGATESRRAQMMGRGMQGIMGGGMQNMMGGCMGMMGGQGMMRGMMRGAAGTPAQGRTIMGSGACGGR